MPVYQDQTGRYVTLDRTPRRIVSLVPSISELLCDLGVRPVGRTKFCIHPGDMADVEVIGGTKNVRIEKIRALSPELVIANKEENPKNVVEALSKFSPVWVTEVKTVDDCIKMIADLGAITDRRTESEEMTRLISNGFLRMSEESAEREKIKALYLIWKKPYMAAGTDSFISSVMEKTGVINCLETWGKEGKRYPKLTVEDMKNLHPDIVLLSSEPYPFKAKDRTELNTALGCPTRLVDGECFSWYGSRMAKSLVYLSEFSRKIRNPQDFMQS
jgi:ABC-type Fe3+-hydroxamate transport system substrate-binding protein